MSKTPRDDDPVEKNFTFGYFLKRELVKRQKTQNWLAGEMYGFTKNSRGYAVARGSDRISIYCRGEGMPDEGNLKKMGDLLGISYEDMVRARAGFDPFAGERRFYPDEYPNEFRFHRQIGDITVLVAPGDDDDKRERMLVKIPVEWIDRFIVWLHDHVEEKA